MKRSFGGHCLSSCTKAIKNKHYRNNFLVESFRIGKKEIRIKYGPIPFNTKNKTCVLFIAEAIILAAEWLDIVLYYLSPYNHRCRGILPLYCSWIHIIFLGEWVWIARNGLCKYRKYTGLSLSDTGKKRKYIDIDKTLFE